MDYRRNMMDLGFPGGCQDFVVVRNTDELSPSYILYKVMILMILEAIERGKTRKKVVLPFPPHG